MRQVRTSQDGVSIIGTIIKMSLFPRWSKEKLTEDELEIISNSSKHIADKESERDNNLKNKKRLLDEEVLDQDNYDIRCEYENHRCDQATKKARTSPKGVGESYRVLKYPYRNPPTRDYGEEDLLS
jgi:hypothetical protein